MDWILFWAVATGIMTVLSIVGGIFRYIRKSETENMQIQLNTLDTKIVTLTADLNKKLDEAEFRRFEERTDKTIQTIIDKTDTRIDKLEAKLYEKFERLYELLNRK